MKIGNTDSIVCIFSVSITTGGSSNSSHYSRVNRVSEIIVLYTSFGECNDQSVVSLIINQHTNVMFSVSKLTMVDMKLSFMTADRMPFQVSPFSPRSVQIDSSAILTTEGGLAMERTSTSCCFLIDRTAVS